MNGSNTDLRISGQVYENSVVSHRYTSAAALIWNILSKSEGFHYQLPNIRPLRRQINISFIIIIYKWIIDLDTSNVLSKPELMAEYLAN